MEFAAVGSIISPPTRIMGRRGAFTSTTTATLRHREYPAHRAALANYQEMDWRRSALAMRTARSSSGYYFYDVPLGCGRSVADDEPDLDWFKRPRNPDEPDPDWFDQRQAWKPFEIHLDDGRILVFD